MLYTATSSGVFTVCQILVYGFFSYTKCFTLSLIEATYIIFVNSLERDQYRQNVGPDLGPSCLKLTLIVFLKKIWGGKLILKLRT